MRAQRKDAVSELACAGAKLLNAACVMPPVLRSAADGDPQLGCVKGGHVTHGVAAAGCEKPEQFLVSGGELAMIVPATLQTPAVVTVVHQPQYGAPEGLAKDALDELHARRAELFGGAKP